MEGKRIENIAVRIKAVEYKNNPTEMAKHIRKFRHCFPSITEDQIKELENIRIKK